MGTSTDDFSSVSCCITLPLGFFQDKVGVGEPSALQVNFTVCPIQEWDVTGATVSTVAASVKYNHATNATKGHDIAEKYCYCFRCISKG